MIVSFVCCSFEESTSLMSAESLSQETSSGNFEQEKPAPKTIARADSSGSNDTNSSGGGPPVKPVLRKTNSLKSTVKTAAVRRTELPKRTSSLRTPQQPVAQHKPAAKAVPPSVKSVVTAKSAVLQRPAAATVVRSASAPKPVERSSSKSSLRSSRSSLNSTTSAGTVKPRIPGIGTYTRAINDLTTELKAGGKPKPLGTLQLHNRNGAASSNTAVLVGKPKPKPQLSTSFKENQARLGGRPLGFMRPTASSTAKDSIDGGGGKPAAKPLFRKNFK